MPNRFDSHRHYHDQRHLRECLAVRAVRAAKVVAARWGDLCKPPGEVVKCAVVSRRHL